MQQRREKADYGSGGANKSHTIQNPRQDIWVQVGWLNGLTVLNLSISKQGQPIHRKLESSEQIRLPWPLPATRCVEKGGRDHISPLCFINPNRNADGSPTGQFRMGEGKSQLRNWAGVRGGSLQQGSVLLSLLSTSPLGPAKKETVTLSYVNGVQRRRFCLH